MKRCYRCGTEWREEKRPSAKDSCEKCNAYIRCCLNCRFYDEHAHNHCKIPTTEWVGDVGKGNFCDEFTFADRVAEDSQAGEEKQARNAFDGLFGGSD
jgi:hypothetical protein